MEGSPPKNIIAKNVDEKTISFNRPLDNDLSKNSNISGNHIAELSVVARFNIEII